MIYDPLAVVAGGSFPKDPAKQTKFLPGAYRGIVEFNNDPEQRGRIKVRIYQLHGPPEREEKKRVPTEHLPWALPCLPLAGAQDTGSFIIPAVGSGVWVLAAGGRPDQFVYLGGYYSTPNDPDNPPKYLRSMEYPKHEISMAGEKEEWTGNIGPETPLDALEILHASPEVYVLAKTVKGATFLARDIDERESLEVIDRMGQGLFMESELTVDANKNNAKRRKVRSVPRGKVAAKVAGESVANETRMMLLDAAGQGVTLHAHKGAERIRVISRPVEEGSVGYGGHKREVALDLDAGARKIVLSTSSSADSVTRIVVDSETGHVEISSSGTTMIYSDSYVIRGDVHIDGTLTVEGDAVVQGDALVASRIVGGEMP